MTLYIAQENLRELAVMLAEEMGKNPLLTVSEAAKRKGVSQPTFRAWVEKGYITPIPEMTEARFPQNKVDALFS